MYRSTCFINWVGALFIYSFYLPNIILLYNMCPSLRVTERFDLLPFLIIKPHYLLIGVWQVQLPDTVFPLNTVWSLIQHKVAKSIEASNFCAIIYEHIFNWYYYLTKICKSLIYHQNLLHYFIKAFLKKRSRHRIKQSKRIEWNLDCSGDIDQWFTIYKYTFKQHVFFLFRIKTLSTF